MSRGWHSRPLIKNDSVRKTGIDLKGDTVRTQPASVDPVQDRVPARRRGPHRRPKVDVEAILGVGNTLHQWFCYAVQGAECESQLSARVASNLRVSLCWLRADIPPFRSIDLIAVLWAKWCWALEAQLAHRRLRVRDVEESLGLRVPPFCGRKLMRHCCSEENWTDEASLMTEPLTQPFSP